jgi:hypothetical protein
MWCGVCMWNRLKVVADVLKYGGKMAADDSIADSMYSAEVLAVFRKRDATLKQIYAHYATLDMTSADVTSWKAVKQANRSININEVLMLLLNFEIVPHLVTKREAMDVFRAVNLGPYGATIFTHSPPDPRMHPRPRMGHTHSLSHTNTHTLTYSHTPLTHTHSHTPLTLHILTHTYPCCRLH